MNKLLLIGIVIAGAIGGSVVISTAPQNPLLAGAAQKSAAHLKKVKAEEDYAKASKVVRVCPSGEAHPASYIMQGPDGRLHISFTSKPTSYGDLIAVGQGVVAKDLC